MLVDGRCIAFVLLMEEERNSVRTKTIFGSRQTFVVNFSMKL